MTLKKPGINTAIEQILAERREAGDLPPSAEELIAYRDGVLSPAQDLDIQQRLLLDKSAITTLLDLESFPQIELEDGHELSPEQQAEAWADMQARIATFNGAENRDRRFHHKRAWNLGALAQVALLAACLLMGFWVFKLKREEKMLLRPALDTHVSVVYLDQISRSFVLEEPEDQSWQHRAFQFPFPRKWQGFAQYRVEIFDVNQSKALFQKDVPGPRNMLEISLNRDWFQHSGPYRIELQGLREGRPEKLGSINISITL